MEIIYIMYICIYVYVNVYICLQVYICSIDIDIDASQ